ncbi:MAG: hypothetical protein JNN13_14355 [Planctomycetes bacterium]|jgi:hypothetical protein|nr:hypothetical protein [Planctomycetota bacterium]
MELLYIFIPIFVFVLIKTVIDGQLKARSDRVKLLEEALKNPNIDRQTVESLAFQLTGARPARAPGTPKFAAAVLAVGWIGLFAGIAMWIASMWVYDKDLTLAGIITSIVGLGVVTYPFALRELEARRSPQ